MPTDPSAREIDALRERLSRLSAASMRINESLEVEDVLQGVLDSARSLTDARFGVIALLNGIADSAEMLYSGMSDEQASQLSRIRGGQAVFDHLNGVEEPLRLGDFNAHLRSLDLPQFHPDLPIGEPFSFLMAPVRYRGERVATIYLAEKQSDDPSERTFNEADEEFLVTFAAQAAMVIINARRYRDEQQARNDLETLINTSPIGVAVFNAKSGSLVSFNREARRIVQDLRDPDKPTEQLLNALIIRRSDGREFRLTQVPLAEVLKSGETVRSEEIVLLIPDGRKARVLVNATPIYSDAEQLETVVVTMQDMSALEELERLRAEFLGMVSHELRAPLAAIRGSATTMLDEEPALDPAEMRQFHRIIVEEADRMRSLLTELLDIARIESGTLPVSPSPAEVTDLVDEARSTFLSGGGRDNIHIDFEADLPAVMADRRRIVQVLGNLLSNASKYSQPVSPITVSAVAEETHVAISVADQGRGLDVDRLPHLFSKFGRIEGEDGRREIAGAGLGLAICRGIVEAHGGRIWAESEGPGLGAKFTFTLPIAETASLSAPVTRRSSGRRTRSQPTPMSVLAVDDDPRALRYVRDCLTKAGYAPFVTGDPEEAIELMQARSPRLVLLDLMLPGTDGIELMQRIFEIANVPVIFLSAYGQEEVVARAFDMGAVDYLVKPFSPTELAARIRAALRRRTMPERLEPSEPYVFEELTIDYADRRVYLDGQPVSFTATEYDLLFELSIRSGRVLTHEQLQHQVWGAQKASTSGLARTIVKRLRRKLNDDALNPRFIFTEPRVGYRLAKSENAPPTDDEQSAADEDAAGGGTEAASVET